MRIADNIKLKDIQTAFRRKFPYLKIEFYRYPHREGEGSLEATQLNPDTLVGEIREVHNNGFFPLDGSMKTATFEQMLQNIYGLNTQVFRKSYGKWLQTWATDVWTLEEQNKRGQIMGDRGILLETP